MEQQQKSDSESDSEDSEPKSFDSSESESGNWFASVEEEMALPVTIKTNVELPVYSGHPVNTKYNGKDGPCMVHTVYSKMVNLALTLLYMIS